MVLRMRSDMKDAMREKDKNRLALQLQLAFCRANSDPLLIRLLPPD